MAVRPRRVRLEAGIAGLFAVLALLVAAQVLGPAWPSPPFAAEPASELPQFGALEDATAVPDTADEATSPYASIAIPEPSPTPGPLRPSTHVIEEGDTLLALADRYRLRPETLLWANDLPNPDLIVVGQRLVIPPVDGLVYTIEAGDRLSAIAERYGVDLFQIAAANGIADPDQASVGLELVLPGARPLAPSRLIAAGPNTAPDAVSLPSGGGSLAPLEAPLPSTLPELLASAWLRTTGPNALYSGPEMAARRFTSLTGGVRVERTGDLAGRRIPVRDPGDGRTRQAMSGWIEVDNLEPSRAPAPRELPRAYPANARMDIFHSFVPYRGQLDGSPYAEANCGPTAVGMVLEGFGIRVPQPKLRAEVLNAQRMGGNRTGTLITALAQAIESYGLTTLDLRRGNEIHRWSLEEVRQRLEMRQPLVVQVRYRALPGREGAYFYGDHYIVVTGALDDGFLYNDPIDHDGPGWDRVISGERLARAMDTSDRRYAQAAFAVTQ
jgi:LysM repeat protein